MNPHLYSTRRQVLRSSAGLAGLTLPGWMQMRAEAATEQALASAPKAKSCIVLFLWGGLAQQESFDPKPDAQSDYKSKFGEIPTATPGIQFCEHLPLLAKHSEKMAIVRSVIAASTLVSSRFCVSALTSTSTGVAPHVTNAFAVETKV